MQRMFLSFSEEEECLFCSVCLAHGNEKQKPSSFVTGFNSWTHIHQRIVEHESSKRHQECVEAYLHFSANRTILDMVQGQQYSLRKQQVLHRRLIVDRVVSIVKVIGKRGMPYRGKAGCEAVNVLANDRMDHGTFLEIVILVANAIAEEVQQAGIFLVQLDTTQDVTQADKCAIVLRYVTDKVEERLIGVVDSHSGKGSDLCKLMSNVLKQNGIDITKCVSDSTDGASNMAGAYDGFTTFFEKASPGHIHTWCYAHVLNLVVCDASSSNEASMTLFGILQKAAMFFRESYLRMDLWTDHMKEKNGQNIHKRLIGATRWRSKHDVLQKFFGTFRDGKGALYTDVVQVLEIAVSSAKLSVEARYDAQCLLTSLLKYKTVLTGFVYLRIMESTTPLSKRLQTSGLNFIKAFEMVKATISEIQTQSRNFDQVKVAADHFINVSATILDEKECDCVIQTDLPMVRKRIRKVMAGELANDDPLTDPLKKFEVEVHNDILDTVLRSLSTQFASHGELYSDMSCFDRNGFSELLECNIQKKSFRKSHVIFRQQAKKLTVDDVH
ncbi:uncharacterized protein LOC136089840 [Hydra vulgaris]|uniref:Uncharacterized protein LOC136089840 n=1 Tax=Hydra vulgaris TaxID=6087 RepID=A0ABM4DC92_HYDVU